MDHKLRELYNRESVEAYNRHMRKVANKSAGPIVRNQRKQQREVPIENINGTTMHKDVHTFP